ncbi:HSPB1-associated protein 1 homolog [Haliotis cracherodii]|uniref:HSPB1-associated protein 1 homolog n=1 Tax=Haliotis cracherodii TaxID=6455 RepID=UPI0039E979CC
MACEEEQSHAEILRRASCPVVFSGLINHWSSLHWTPSHLAHVLQGKTYRCKIAPRKSTEKVWETDCAHIEASLADFADWTAGSTRGGNPLCHVSLEDFSCYVDYKYMSVMFEDCSDLLKSVDWSVFGLSGRDGKDSTIWIGSGGASTPCHYDTYGYNLVAQLHGRKRWHLFPPSSTEALYPTRLPYEESSVFSEVNVGQPDLSKHPLFKESQAVVVTLEPGQVLYVPRHWWHYVECLHTAISINTWVDVPTDDESRLSESVTRATISCLVNSDIGAQLEHWINPGEQIMPMDVNLTYVERCLHSQADRSVSDNPEANGIASKDNLQKFLQHFKTKQFDMVHAPWHIPGGASIVKMRQDNRDTCLHDQARVRDLKRQKMSVNHSEVEMNNLKRKKTNEKCIDEIPGVVHKENIDDRNLHDRKKARLASGPLCECKDSVQSTCGIFALQTSCFDTYFNLVHESRTKVIDSVGGSEAGDIQDMVGIGDENTVNLLMGHQSEGDTSASVSATHQTEGDTSASVSATHQTEGDTSVSVSATHQTEGDTSASVSATHQTEGDTSASVSDSAETQESETVDHETLDLSTMKKIFFRSLLHPRVMKAFEEELTKNYKSLMK